LTSDRKCLWEINLYVERTLLLRGPGDSLWSRGSGLEQVTVAPLTKSLVDGDCTSSLAQFDHEVAKARDRFKRADAPELRPWKVVDLKKVREEIEGLGEKVVAQNFTKNFTGCP
jgi:hypothetical protein